MNILHVIASLAQETGGPAKAVLEMAEAVAGRGHTLTVFTTDFGGVPDTLDRLREAGVTVRVFPVEAPRIWKRSPQLAAALADAIPDMDAVHIHSLYLYHDWVAGGLCRRYGVPYIVRPHGSLDPFLYKRHRFRKSVMDVWFQNRMLREAAAVHFTTEEEHQLARPYISGAPGAVVANGINFADYAEVPPEGLLRHRYPQLADSRIVLFLSRLNFKKGLDVLIPAFSEAAKDADDLRLVLAGPDDGMESRARAWAREYGIEDKTVFTGMLTGSEIQEAYRDAEMFALPSYSENFGIAVVEAMAMGVPVLISDKVNIWREVAGAGAGLVSAPDVDSFADLIARAAAPDFDLAGMGAKARELAQRRFDWSEIGGDLEALYRSVSEPLAKAA
jgi:glycosyltransferase involved in cell wall biosynthesis